jgi:trk system potassium uptake protein TrkH
VRNYWVDFWLIVLMVLGATSFSLIYLIMKKHNLKAFINDSEARTLLILGLLVAVISFPKLGLESALFHAFSAVTAGGFQLVSSITASGWEDIVKFLLIMLMLIGGSTNSTAGGIKIARFVIFVKSMFWKIKESMMPKGTVFSRKFEGKELRAEHLAEIYFFILAYLFFIGLGTIVVLLDGAELSDAMFEVVSAQSNAGISAGISKPGMPLATEIMLIFNMWIGRLEIIPLFALLALFKRGH